MPGKKALEPSIGESEVFNWGIGSWVALVVGELGLLLEPPAVNGFSFFSTMLVFLV